MRTLIYSFLLVGLLLAPANRATANSEQDREAAQKIANNMKSSGLLKDYRVGVKYQDGVAWLTGTVTSDAQKATAEKIARRSAGVEHLVSKLTIGPGQKKSKEQPPVVQQSAPRPLKAKPMADASVKPVVNRETGQRKADLANIHRGRMHSKQPVRSRRSMARRKVRNNSPRPYARIGQAPRNAQAGRRGQPVRPASYGGPAMGMGQPMGAAGPMPAGRGQAVSYDNPQMPGYAWPSYAANPNYAALTYPTQYSPSAWPYIGPFYPYPQVPLGWRKVTLEWDDGWWFLDFKDCKDCR